MFEATLKAHRSIVFFHDVGERITHDIGLLTLYGRESDLSLVKTVRCGKAVSRLDHEACLIEIVGSHRDPLYIVHAEGRYFIEVGLYALSLDDEVITVELADGNKHNLAVKAPCDFSVFNNLPLASSVLPTSNGRQLLLTLSPHAMEVVEQRMVDKRFFETRAIYDAGRHEIVYTPDQSLAYFGVSLNVKLPSGHDYEHKHVFHGRL